MIQSNEENKILIAYFSHSGNTRVIANQIHEFIGGDVFEILPEKQYPSDYNTVMKQAKKELDSSYKPKLKTRIENLESYDMIFIGYPNWWNTIPMPIVSFLTEYNFSRKIIIPFCTHGGTYLGRSVEDIKKLCPNSTVLSGLEVRDRDLKNAQDKISKWLSEIK